LRNLEFTSCQTMALWLKIGRLHKTAKLFFSLRSTPYSLTYICQQLYYSQCSIAPVFW
jgi:hypothetical protein